MLYPKMYHKVWYMWHILLKVWHKVWHTIMIAVRHKLRATYNPVSYYPPGPQGKGAGPKVSPRVEVDK